MDGRNRDLARSILKRAMEEGRTDSVRRMHEDIAEEYSHIDRDFCYLRRSGLLEKIGGLVLGQFSDMRDSGTPFEFSFEDIIAEHTAGLNIPILMNAPFGHDTDLYALPVGREAELSDNQLTLM